MFSCVLHVFSQLKSLFEIFTFVSERNIKYQYLIMASLILVACYRNSVSRFSTNIKYQYLIMASLILVACYRNSVNRFSTNIKYQYFILASLILVACYRNSVSRVSTIQLPLFYRTYLKKECSVPG